MKNWKQSNMTWVLIFIIVFSAFPIGCGGGGGAGGVNTALGGGAGSSGYTVSGKVTEWNGTTPVQYGTVTLEDSAARGSIRAFSETTTTNANGVYNFYNISAGNYKLVLSQTGHVTVVFFLSVTGSTSSANGYIISMTDWDTFMGDGNHPYDPNYGYFIIKTQTQDQASYRAMLSGASVSCNPAGEGQGYISGNVVSWTATSTSDEGKAFIYKINPASAYSVNATKPFYQFTPLSNITVDAGELYVYDINGVDVTANVTSIAINPTSASIPNGLYKQFAATAIYNDGSTADVTNIVEWTSSNTSAGTVGNGDAAGGKGLFKTVATGSTTVKATYGNLTAEAGVTVTNVSLQSIVITPYTGYVSNQAGHNTQQFTATGSYSDGSQQDLTLNATWKTQNSNPAGVGTINSSGLFTAQVVGTIQVQAEYNDPVSGLKQSNVSTVNVESKFLTQISISPSSKTIPYGYDQDFKAVGTYNDASTRYITDAVTWSSSNTTVLTYYGIIGTPGVTPADQITARFRSAGSGSANALASLSGVQGTATVTVQKLLTLSIDPAGVEMADADYVQLSAWATYEGTSEQYDVTQRVTWTSSGKCPHDKYVLISGTDYINNIPSLTNQNGYFFTRCIGKAVVTVTLADKTAISNITCRWGQISGPNMPFIETISSSGYDPQITAYTDMYNVDYYSGYQGDAGKNNGRYRTVGVSYTYGTDPSTHVSGKVRGIYKSGSGFAEDTGWTYGLSQTAVADGKASSLSSYIWDKEAVDFFGVTRNTTLPVIVYQYLGIIRGKQYTDTDPTTGWAYGWGGFPNFSEADGYDASIAYNSTGNNYGVAYTRATKIYYQNTGGGGEQEIDAGDVVSLAFGGGTPSFSFELGTEPFKQLKARVALAGQTKNVDLSSGYASSIANNPQNNRPAVAYESSDGSNRSVKYSEYDGANWSAPGTIDYGYRPHLSFSDDGRPNITYTSTNGQVRYAYKNSSGNWRVNVCSFGTIDGNITEEGTCDSVNHTNAAVYPYFNSKGPAVTYAKGGAVKFQKRYGLPDQSADPISP